MAFGVYYFERLFAFSTGTNVRESEDNFSFLQLVTPAFSFTPFIAVLIISIIFLAIFLPGNRGFLKLLTL